MKVLVVDDDAVVRKLIETQLSLWGYDPVCASNGEEALALVDVHDPPIIITDWMMPKMDGVELVRRVRAREGHQRRSDYIYLILVSARADMQDLIHAMDAGADDYLTKPFDPEELRVRVRAGERVVELERQLAEQNRVLRDTQSALVQSEKLASIGQLAAGVAHEINNPLAYVINTVAVLRRDLQGEEVGAHLARCSDGLRRVRDIVRNMLDFAHLDEAEVDEADLNEALRSTLEIVTHEVRRKRVELTTDYGDLPPLRCRPGKLNQVFLNLVVNAVQAVDEGGHVHVRTSFEKGEILVEVRDDGPGIEPDVISRVFDPFFTTKPVGSGTGLGLSVSYGIVRDHGGEIEVESVPGEGAMFRVRLPLP